MVDVAAMAAGVPDLRTGVGAVTRCRAGGAGAATVGDSGAPALSRPGAVAGEGGVVFGTTSRATGREFGSGGLPFAAVLSDGFSAACFGAGLSVVGLAADFSGLAAGFSADFLPAGFSAACLAAGFAFAWVAAGFSGLSVSANAESPSASVRPAASTVDRAVDRRGDARKSGIKERSFAGESARR